MFGLRESRQLLICTLKRSRCRFLAETKEKNLIVNVNNIIDLLFGLAKIKQQKKATEKN